MFPFRSRRPRRHELADQRVFCVVGMHRSGTSSLAGSLQLAGVEFGEVPTENAFNPKGNRESEPIRFLHDRILEENGGDWASPPGQIKWNDGHRTTRDEIIRSFNRATVWGFKDPRTLLVLDLWREAIPQLELVGTFRHPRFVVESLLRRSGGNEHDWLRTWIAYNKPLVAEHRRQAFPLLRFDEPPECYRTAVAGVLADLALDARAGSSFFNPELRHGDGEPAAVSEDAQSLYDRLCELWARNASASR